MFHKGKRASLSLKTSIISDHLEKGVSISELARLHNVTPATIYAWRRNMEKKPEEIYDVDQLLAEIAELKKKNKIITEALGEAKIDQHILKVANEHLKKKWMEQQLALSKKSSKKKS